MESTKNSRSFLLVMLVVTVVGLVALDIFQARVIERQRFEMHWLVTHAVFRPDGIAADAAKAAPGAAAGNAAKAPAANVAVVPPSAKPAAPPPTAKP